MIYEHGTREIPAGQHFNGNPDTSLGKFEHFEAVPNDPDALQFLLREEKQKRDKLTPGDFKEHTAALRAGLIEAEARRIVQEMKRRDTPNSPTVMGNDQIVEKYLSNEQIRPYVSNLNRMEIGNIKSTASDGISSPVDWSKFRKQIVQHLPQDVVDLSLIHI